MSFLLFLKSCFAHLPLYRFVFLCSFNRFLASHLFVFIVAFFCFILFRFCILIFSIELRKTIHYTQLADIELEFEFAFEFYFDWMLAAHSKYIAHVSPFLFVHHAYQMKTHASKYRHQNDKAHCFEMTYWLYFCCILKMRNDFVDRRE